MARVSGESHWISWTTGGLVWSRPYGTSWIRPKSDEPGDHDDQDDFLDHDLLPFP